MATVSERIVDARSAHVTELSGVTGNGNAHVLDAAARASMRSTTVRHEAGAVVAADAYFRAGGALAVATTTYGPGSTNVVTPLAEGVQAGSSVVVVVGDALRRGSAPGTWTRWRSRPRSAQRRSPSPPTRPTPSRRVLSRTLSSGGPPSSSRSRTTWPRRRRATARRPGPPRPRR